MSWEVRGLRTAVRSKRGCGLANGVARLPNARAYQLAERHPRRVTVMAGVLSRPALANYPYVSFSDVRLRVWGTQQLPLAHPLQRCLILGYRFFTASAKSGRKNELS